MNVQFKESFARDLRSLKDKALLTRVKELIEVVEQAKRLDQIPSLKKLKGGPSYYRIKLGDYRAGLVIDGDIVTFV